MNPQKVIVFCGDGANQSILGLMHDYAEALGEIGLTPVELSFEDAELRYAVELMRAGEVRFAMTWLGFGQDLRGVVEGSAAAQNVFEYCNVPLVKLHGDLPAYYIDYHRDIPRNSVNLYQAAEFIQFREAWLADAHAVASLIPPMPMVPMQLSDVNLDRRKQGKLVFVKNGNAPAALKDKWESQLPSHLAELLKRMATELVGAGLGGAVQIGDWVPEFLDNEAATRRPPRKLVWFLAAQLDDYLRRVKSTLVAEALLDLPVVVQGSFWEHVDFRGRRAQHLPGEDVFTSQRIVREELGVIDMSPNVHTWPHDRVQRAAGSYALFLTNRQSWLTEEFSEFEALTYDFEASSIASKVEDVLAHRSRYLEMAVVFGKEFRTRFPRQAFSERVLLLADCTRMLWSEPKPQIQNFFVWTRME